MIIYTPPVPLETIPIVDMADADSPDPAVRRAIAWDVHKACRDTGFFYVVNHGIPAERLRRQLDCARRFFALPDAVKHSVDIARSTNMRGYEPMALQTLDAGTPPDLKESFMSARELGPEHRFVRAGMPYEGANLWPKGEDWMRETVLEYNDLMIATGRRIAALLALSLDLPEDHFADALEEPGCTVRLLRYPPHPPMAEANQLGCGAHTDWGFLTLLLQDEIGGLEVRNAAGQWVRATPVPGSLLVNLGDMVPELTNRLYHSTAHRVLNNVSDRDRYSVACFFGPPNDYVFDCVATCRPSDGSFVPNPRTMGAHIRAMFELSYGAR